VIAFVVNAFVVRGALVMGCVVKGADVKGCVVKGADVKGFVVTHKLYITKVLVGHPEPPVSVIVRTNVPASKLFKFAVVA